MKEFIISKWHGTREFWLKHGTQISLFIVVLGIIILSAYGIILTNHVKKQSDIIAAQNEQLKNQIQNTEEQLEILRQQKGNRIEAVEDIKRKIDQHHRCLLTAINADSPEERMERCEEQFSSQNSTQSSNTQSQSTQTNRNGQTSTSDNQGTTSQNNNQDNNQKKTNRSNRSDQGEENSKNDNAPGQNLLDSFLDPTKSNNVLGL